MTEASGKRGSAGSFWIKIASTSLTQAFLLPFQSISISSLNLLSRSDGLDHHAVDIDRAGPRVDAAHDGGLDLGADAVDHAADADQRFGLRCQALGIGVGRGRLMQEVA